MGRDKGKRKERRRVGGSLRAKALEGLNISNKEIADIALACEFDSLGHFYHRFRTFNDESLEQYRQRQTAAVQVKLGARAF